MNFRVKYIGTFLKGKFRSESAMLNSFSEVIIMASAPLFIASSIKLFAIDSSSIKTSWAIDHWFGCPGTGLGALFASSA